MEGRLDVEERGTAPEAAQHVPGADEEQEEGNKFQKAIGAWRSMFARITGGRRG
jgi:hypothetical protein